MAADIDERIMEITTVVDAVAWDDSHTPDEARQILEGVRDALMEQLAQFRPTPSEQWDKFAGHIRESLAQGPQHTCDGCHQEIIVGQHYLRGAALAETAGFPNVLGVPEMIWDGIFDTPGCLAMAILQAAKDRKTALYDVFNPNR